MFSATIPEWVDEIAKKYFSRNMKKINLIKDASIRTSETVDHFGMEVSKNERHSVVKTFIEEHNPNKRTIIFTQTKAEAN